MAKRKFEVEITESRKGDGFKDSERSASRWGKKLGDEGEKAGDKLAKGIKDGTDKVGSTLESAGSAAGDIFSSGFDPSSIADALADGLSSSSGKLGTAAAGAGVAAAAAFTAGLMNGMENELATDRLAAQLGGSEWAQGMGEVAGDLYLQGFGESVADVGTSLRGVLQAGILPEDSTNAQIERMTGRFLTFTDVMEQDMDMATQAVSNMIRTGIAEDGAEALDLLTRGIQQGADRAGDLQEVFQEYSTMFRDVGLSGSDAMGLITQGLQAGARDADTVADSLKEFAIRAQDGSETSAEGFKAIGLNAKDMTAAVAAGGPQARAALDQVLDGLRNMENPAERNAAAVALFGTKAEDLGDALFSLDLDTAAAGLGQTSGATDKLGSAYDNASSKIETFRRQALEKLTVFVGEQVLPRLEALQRWATENPGAFQVIAGVIGTVLVVAFAAWAASAASAAAATIAATWPILLIGAAVAGLAALVVIHFGTIKRWISNVWNWVKNNWPLLLGILTGPFGLAVLAISRNWQTIKDGVSAVKRWIVDRWNGVVDFVRGLPGRISRAVRGMWDGIGDSFKSAINRIIRWWNNLSFPTFHIPSIDPLGSFGPSIGGGSIGGWELPNIPTLHEGGMYRAPRRGGEGLAMLLDGEVVSGPGGAGSTVNFHRGAFEGAIISSETDAERWVVGALQRAGSKGVPITIAGRRL